MSIFDSSAKIEQETDECVRNLPVEIIARNMTSSGSAASISAEWKIMRERFGVKAVDTIELKMPQAATIVSYKSDSQWFPQPTAKSLEIVLRGVESNVRCGVLAERLFSPSIKKSDSVFNCIVNLGEGCDHKPVKFICSNCIVTGVTPAELVSGGCGMSLYDIHIDVDWYQVIV